MTHEKNTILGFFSDWTLWEKSWLSISVILMLTLSLYWKDSAIGIIASLTGIICVVLVAKGRISNYYFGIVNVVAYAYVAYGWQYYGEVMLNLLYFLPIQFYGIWYWMKNRKQSNKDEVYVKFMSNRQRIMWGLISVASIIGYGVVLKMIKGSLPFIDSTSTVLSIIAMILMVRLYMEQWILWIIVDVVSIIMWVVVLMKGGNDIAILIMWTAYLVNAVYGLVNWIKLYKAQGARR
ncbi:nicotinamide riboside transporter pnuC [Candidatus Woesearchaeota archaeon CG11_big_fil_rev_8_21_14_0_20_43_8]|nr:MAG: nicotinamide riboside transporter pnuC [Candidatus Woesearchaeota archaeon CG11_big_fil_rev_8_21_14_0_20_43_8]PIO06691.1 MAG: nicotinamide riboside transporter PnuC [Candidatus Woesearchaeota archaeon CG08_land_8_20_14_0_20_43_7]